MTRGIRRLIFPLVFLLSSACIDPGVDRDDDETLASVSSAVYTATVTASPSVVELGQNVTASWTTVAEHSVGDWIGMFKVGAADNVYLTWKYVGGAGQTSGNLIFVLPLTAALDPGPYEFRYFSASVKLATSNAFTGYANYALTGTPSSVELGQTASVTWQAPLAHSPGDYITLAKVGSADNVFITWQYVGHANETTGSLTFTVPLTAALDPGPYEFRYFFASVKRATSDSFVGTAAYSLTGTPGTVELGQTASVTWHAPLAHSPGDYVTLAKVGTPDNAFLTWQYVGHANEITGTLTFTVPLTQALDPGPYEFRYFFASVKRATSPSFTGYAEYSVSAPTKCRTGQPVSLAWTAPLAHSPGDTVGIYTTAGAVVTWNYVGGAGQSAGSVTVTGPVPGGYELRYMFGSRVTAVGTIACANPP